MVEYFIGEFYRTNSVNLSHIVTPTFKFDMVGTLPLSFPLFVKLTEAIRNVVKLNVYDLHSDDDVVFRMKYLLEVLKPFGGFGIEITGTITVTLIGDLVDRIDVTRSHCDGELKKYLNLE